MNMARLSKTRILNHLQCPKRLYLQTFRPELAEESEEAEQAFAVGHEVGELARREHPDGLLIQHDTELSLALRQTRELVTNEPRRSLFEATFQHDGVLVRADLLLPGERERHLVEVKSSTSVKPHYLSDCAIQAWVIESAGVPIERIELEHIDNRFVYLGDDNYRGLLHREDVTGSVRSLLPQVPKWVAHCRATLTGGEPAIPVGAQCKDPNPCPFFTHCQGPQPEYPITKLYYGGKIIGELLAEGITDLRAIPPGRLTNPVHERQRHTTVNGQPELDTTARDVLAKHPYPRYYLDFETIRFAVPVWRGTRPYEKLPFQWSCHIETGPGVLTHEDFLGLPPDVPMRGFAERLITSINSQGRGPIFVYNQGFEAARLRELAARFPDLAADLLPIIDRMVDLLPIARKHYYHPAMKGSWSLKAVLPTIASDLDYAQLEHVQHGGMAEQAYAEIINPSTAEERRNELIQGLREYCAQDTLAMVRLVRFFETPRPQPIRN
jgi:hypothetical protein